MVFNLVSGSWTAPRLEQKQNLTAASEALDVLIAEMTNPTIHLPKCETLGFSAEKLLFTIICPWDHLGQGTFQQFENGCVCKRVSYNRPLRLCCVERNNVNQGKLVDILCLLPAWLQFIEPNNVCHPIESFHGLLSMSLTHLGRLSFVRLISCQRWSWCFSLRQP